MKNEKKLKFPKQKNSNNCLRKHKLSLPCASFEKELCTKQDIFQYTIQYDGKSFSCLLKLMKGKALRKHSLHEKTAAYSTSSFFTKTYVSIIFLDKYFLA